MQAYRAMCDAFARKCSMAADPATGPGRLAVNASTTRGTTIMPTSSPNDLWMLHRGEGGRVRVRARSHQSGSWSIGERGPRAACLASSAASSCRFPSCAWPPATHAMGRNAILGTVRCYRRWGLRCSMALPNSSSTPVQSYLFQAEAASSSIKTTCTVPMQPTMPRPMIQCSALVARE